MIPESVVILGIPLDNLNMDETVDRIFSKENVDQLFRLTKLNHLFHIAPDLAAAEQILKITT